LLLLGHIAFTSLHRHVHTIPRSVSYCYHLVAAFCTVPTRHAAAGSRSVYQCPTWGALVQRDLTHAEISVWHFSAKFRQLSRISKRMRIAIQAYWSAARTAVVSNHRCPVGGSTKCRRNTDHPYAPTSSANQVESSQYTGWPKLNDATVTSRFGARKRIPKRYQRFCSWWIKVFSNSMDDCCRWYMRVTVNFAVSHFLTLILTPNLRPNRLTLILTLTLTLGNGKRRNRKTRYMRLWVYDKTPSTS